jgi:predicted RNA binding protein YcfA (HicA-like mRNA interferase family)
VSVKGNKFITFDAHKLYTLMKASDLIQMLTAAGWHEVRQQGQHRIFSHASRPNLISVPDLGDQSLKLGLLNDILREAGFVGRVKKAPRLIQWIVSLIKRVQPVNEL